MRVIRTDPRQLPLARTVNEFSTSQLFKSFYTYLFAGQTKSASLRATKLAYLDSETPDERKAPFYWAAFTFTGADRKVDLGRGFQWLYLWVVLGGIRIRRFHRFLKCSRGIKICGIS